jgi:hypothetical protein
MVGTIERLIIQRDLAGRWWPNGLFETPGCLGNNSIQVILSIVCVLQVSDWTVHRIEVLMMRDVRLKQFQTEMSLDVVRIQG